MLSTKYPEYRFNDINHYEGSLIVEATFSTSTSNKDDTDAAVKKMSSDIDTAGLKIEYNGETVHISDFDLTFH